MKSASLASDGRPVIEVTEFQLRNRVLSIGGSAVVYEGNVMISLMHGTDVVARHFCQASAGGPERGAWVTEIALPPNVDAVVIHQEHMEETPAEFEAAQQVRISLSGKAS